MASAATIDTVKMMNRFIQHSDIPRYTVPAERDEAVHNWLTEIHTKGTTEATKLYLKECVLVNIYFRMVYVLSERRFSQALFEDALQNMVACAWVAMDNFDPSRGTKFTNYLIGYMREAIDISMRSESIIHVPKQSRRNSMQAALAYYDAVDDAVDNDGDYEGSDAHQTNPHTHHQNAYGPHYHECHIEPDYVPDDIGTDMVFTPPVDPTRVTPNVQVTNNTYTTEDRVYQLQLRQQLDLALFSETNLLSPQELDVIKYRTGVFDSPQCTLEEIAERFRANGMRATKEWVHQLEKRAIAKLQRFFYRNGIRNFSLTV